MWISLWTYSIMPERIRLIVSFVVHQLPMLSCKHALANWLRNISMQVLFSTPQHRHHNRCSLCYLHAICIRSFANRSLIPSHPLSPPITPSLNRFWRGSQCVCTSTCISRRCRQNMDHQRWTLSIRLPTCTIKCQSRSIRGSSCNCIWTSFTRNH